MGKKKGKDKKGKGAEKTIQKTDKKAEKKMKKELKQKGEADIEELIAEFQERDRKQAEILDEKCPPPSPRCNMSLTAHPDRDELLMFGGEYYNGKQTLLYNDLFYYNIRTSEWTMVKSPNPPPPRCAHQAVAVSQSGGQLWVFGGEFASPTQSQFYHYKDLWVLSLRDKTWQKVVAPGGPSARSGHRMVACKKLLVVFGGFHDNIRDYKYYNDVHMFSLESYTWLKLELSGTPPLPRSACMLLASTDQNHITVYGGYSKERVKKDVDLGKTHTDMSILTVDSRCRQESTPCKWRWQTSKQCGTRPSPRSGCTALVVPGNRAVTFGGVFDEVEDEEEVEGVFYNDMYSVELDKSRWYQLTLRGKKDPSTKRKRRKKKDTGEGDTEEGQDEEEEEEEEEEETNMEEDLEELKVSDSQEMEVTDSTVSPSGECSSAPVAPPSDSTTSDAIFTVTVGPSQSSDNNTPAQGTAAEQAEVFVPGKRMNTLLAMKHGILYMYGGVFEQGDKQYTLSDMYSLDLHKLEEWNTIIPCDLNLQDWQESDESSGEEEEEEEEEEGLEKEGEDMDSDSEEEEEEEEEQEKKEEDGMEMGAPGIHDGETLDEYYTRTSQHWLQAATDMAQDEGLTVTDKQLKKAATRIAKEHYKEQQSS